MNILAIETTGALASAAIIDNDECVHEVVSEMGMTHLRNLIPLVDEVLSDCDMKLSDIDGIAVSRGPGSFTGIRIGVTTAKALAQVLGVKVAEVPTLEALAMNFWNFDWIICPILDARRNQVYSAAYKFDGENQHEIYPEGAYQLEEVIEKLRGKGPVIFSGDGVSNESIRAQIEDALGKDAFFASPLKRVQTAEMVAVLGLEIHKAGKAVSYFEAQPEYLRKSEAERNLELKKCGKK